MGTLRGFSTTEPIMNNTEKKKSRKVVCPYCGYEMPIFYDDTAICDGVTVTCKGRSCHAVFIIRINSGEQIK